jgi:IS5 family transposase
MVLRLLILKHVRNWSYQVLEREVRANLVYRDFARVGGERVPDAKTMGRWGLAVEPQVLRQIHDRMLKIAHDNGVVAGRRMRVDTTVVETNIHHPTDSTLLGDGVRVLTRTMRKISAIAGAAGAKLRDRSRNVKWRLLEIARAASAKGPISQQKLKQRYRQLLDATSRVVGQARRFSREIAEGVKRSKQVLRQLALEGYARSSTRWCRWCGRSCGRPGRASSKAIRASKASSSACSSPRPKAFARARPASRTSSARW